MNMTINCIEIEFVVVTNDLSGETNVEKIRNANKTILDVQRSHYVERSLTESWFDASIYSVA